MTAVNYIAKRSIEKTAFSASGTDISANTTDDSFNATSTDLSGGADDEWNNVAGFADPANNGWFQNNGVPITTKIIQDTSDLVTEAAGNAIAIQGYKRGSGQNYDYELKVRTIPRSAKTIRKQHVSIGGQIETLRHRGEVYWDVDTGIIKEEDMGQLREFLDSVDGGESFTFDPHGTVASPDDPVSAILDSSGYQEQQIGKQRKYRLRFRVRKL